MKKIFAVLLAAVLTAVPGCGEENEQHINLSDPMSGSAIVSASELQAFFLYGEKDRATLAGSFSMEDAMLTLSRERGSVTIDGGGFTLSGTADCIIRLDDGASLRLDNITLHSGATAIGCLGSAAIGGSGADIIGVSDGILCADELTIMEGSSISCHGSNGCGIETTQLAIGKNAALTGDGVLGGVSVRDGIELDEGASLKACTDENYNALKCGGLFVMADGAALRAENGGRYNGAEINELSINGTVSMNVKGGREATGLFVAEQHSDMYVVGSCEPAARFENGRGRLHFVSDPGEIPQAAPERPAGQEGQ